MKKEMIKLPFAPKDCKGKDYELVIHRFMDAGFANITATSIADIKVGLFKKIGSVDYVTINGDAKFKKNHEYESDANIRIVYHIKAN